MINQLSNYCSEKSCTSAALVFCIAYFNPCGYKRVYQNLLTTIEALRRGGFRFFVGEACLTECEQTEIEGGCWVRVKAQDPMFFKECIWNLIGKIAAKNAEILVFIDGDILIDEPETFNRRLQYSLAKFDVVQPFSTAIYLDPYGVPLAARTSSGAAHMQCLSTAHRADSYHAGFGFAMLSTTFLRLGGFFPCVIGEGDVLTVAALVQQFDFVTPRLLSLSEAYRDYYFSWLNHHTAWLDSSFGATDGSVRHLFHGSLESRQYDSRLKLFKGLDPGRDIAWDLKTGLPKFSDALDTRGTHFKFAMCEYFQKRNDDG